jgi:hypothetical protein
MPEPLSGHRYDDVAPVRRSHDGALARCLYLEYQDREPA